MFLHLIYEIFHRLTFRVFLDFSDILISKIVIENQSSIGQSGFFFDRIIFDCRDTDNDGIVDYLDLDSKVKIKTTYG